MSKTSRRQRQGNKPTASQSQLSAEEARDQRTSSAISAEISISEHSNTAIPPPSMLAAYNNAVPDGAERILAMAENQQAHRHELEQVVIRGDSRRADRGLYIGGAIICIAIICGTVLVAMGKDAQGLLIGVGSIIGALGAFVWGWKKRQKEVEAIRQRS